jgi:Zn finger protein HypA/HybF involved in hydrogenase expression
MVIEKVEAVLKCRYCGHRQPYHQQKLQCPKCGRNYYGNKGEIMDGLL